MIRLKNLLVLIVTAVGMIAVTNSFAAQKTVTSNQAYQQAQVMISIIKQIRSAEKTEHTPERTPVYAGKTPLHVYAKSLEVLQQVSRLGKKYSLSFTTANHIPFKRITPEDVYENIHLIVSDLTLVKQKLALKNTMNLPPTPIDKTPNDVYTKLWQASELLTGLVSQLSPDYVYRNTQVILAELNQIAKKLNTPLNLTPIKVKVPKHATPADVNQLAYLIMYRLAVLEEKLNMPWAVYPGKPTESDQPADVFDTSINIMVELARIQHHLNIQPADKIFNVPLGKKPPDVFGQMQIIENAINHLIATR